MTNPSKPDPAEHMFLEGDEVVLAKGTYTGTPGIFVRYRPDARWADITERNGTIRNHPVEWLAHAEIRLNDEILPNQIQPNQ
jgi:hypothetical protein